MEIIFIKWKLDCSYGIKLRTLTSYVTYRYLMMPFGKVRTGDRIEPCQFENSHIEKGHEQGNPGNGTMRLYQQFL